MSLSEFLRVQNKSFHAISREVGVGRQVRKEDKLKGVYYYVGHNLFHDKLISQAHVTGLLHLHSPSEEGKKKNLSHISHSISQIPPAWVSFPLYFWVVHVWVPKHVPWLLLPQEQWDSTVAPLPTARQVRGQRETRELKVHTRLVLSPYVFDHIHSK